MSFSIPERQAWISLLAKAPADLLIELSAPMLADQAFETIRAPEVGLTQVRARMGNTGDQFNLGEMTLTRCVVRSSTQLLGYSFVAGRNKTHAEYAAKLDALLQDSAYRQTLIDTVIAPIEQHQIATQAAEKQQTEATRVNFFTLVRGDD